MNGIDSIDDILEVLGRSISRKTANKKTANKKTADEAAAGAAEEATGVVSAATMDRSNEREGSISLLVGTPAMRLMGWKECGNLKLTPRCDSFSDLLSGTLTELG